MTTFKELERLLGNTVARDNLPYAILLDSKNLEILQSECLRQDSENGFINFPNWKAFCGIPIVVNEEYPLKVVTEKEYREIYKASK